MNEFEYVFTIPEYGSGTDHPSDSLPGILPDGRVLSLYEAEHLQIIRKRMLTLQAIIRGAEERIREAPAGTLSVKKYRGRDNYYQSLKSSESVSSVGSRDDAALMPDEGSGKLAATNFPTGSKIFDDPVSEPLSGSGNANASSRAVGKAKNKPVTERYLNKDETDIARALAQKAYDVKVKKLAEAELKAMVSFISALDPGKMDTLYDEIAENRKCLTVPVAVSEEEYAEKWAAAPYPGKESAPSASERVIADTLREHGIPFRAACPVSLCGILVYPSFTILNKRTKQEFYWEHIDSLDQPENAVAAVKHLKIYEQCGILPGKKLIVTQETAGNVLSPSRVEMIIREYFS